MPVTISGVEEGSPAQRHGIRAGERLVSINGHPIEDVLDYRFYLTDTRLKLELEGPPVPVPFVCAKGTNTTTSASSSKRI